MIRMLVVGYVFAIRSERLIRREVQVNLAYRWFCRLGIEDAIPDRSAFSRGPTTPPAAPRSQPTRSCECCGEMPYLVRSLLDSNTGKTIRMFECLCGERSWSEE